MKLVIASIVSHFDLKLVNYRPVRPVRRGLTFAPPNIKAIAILNYFVFTLITLCPLLFFYGLLVHLYFF